jgi:hypothetical protein
MILELGIRNAGTKLIKNYSVDQLDNGKYFRQVAGFYGTKKEALSEAQRLLKWHRKARGKGVFNHDYK